MKNQKNFSNILVININIVNINTYNIDNSKNKL